MAPSLGEILKVEFTIPGGEKIAWVAKVVRLSEDKGPDWWKHNGGDDLQWVFVGVHFLGLPEGHQEAIREGLHKRISEVKKQIRVQRNKDYLNFVGFHKLKFILFCMCTIFTVAFFYLITKPSPSYDADKGSPWGMRYMFFDFEKKHYKDIIKEEKDN